VLHDYPLPKIDGLATARLVGDLMGETARPRLLAITATPDRLVERELLAGRMFDGIVSKLADMPNLATISAFVRSVPDHASGPAAEFELLLHEWADYDEAPERPVTEQVRRRPVSLSSKMAECRICPEVRARDAGHYVNLW